MNFKLKTENIKLGQLIKAVGLVESGVEAKIEVQSGNVKLNGSVCTERGKKIVVGDVVEFNGKRVEVI